MESRQHVFTDGVDLRTSTERGNQSALLSLKNARLFKRGDTGFITSLDGYENVVDDVGGTILAMSSWQDHIIVLYTTASGEFGIKFYNSAGNSLDWTFNYTDTPITEAKITVTENFITVSNHNIYLFYDGTDWNSGTFKSTTPTFSVNSTITGTSAVGYIGVLKGSDASRVTTAGVNAVYRINNNVLESTPFKGTRAIFVNIDTESFTFEYSEVYPTSAQLTNDIYYAAIAEANITNVFNVAFVDSETLSFSATGAYAGTAGNNKTFGVLSPVVETTVTQTTLGVDAIIGETPGTKDDTDITVTNGVPMNVTVTTTITASMTPLAVRDAIFIALSGNPSIVHVTTGYTLQKVEYNGNPGISFLANSVGPTYNGTITINNYTNGISTTETDLTNGTAAPSAQEGTLLSGKAYWYTVRYVYQDGHITKTALPKLVTVGSDQIASLSIDTALDLDGGKARIEVFRKLEGGNFFKVHSAIPTTAIYNYVDKGDLELAGLDEQNYIWTDSHQTQEIVRDRLVRANIEFPDVTVPDAVVSAITVSKNETTITTGNQILPKNTEIDIYTKLRYNDGTDTLFEKITTIDTDDDDANLTVSLASVPTGIKEIALYGNYKKNYGTGNTHKFKSIEFANKNIPFIYTSSVYDSAHPYYDLDEIAPLNPHIFLGWKYITVEQTVTGTGPTLSTSEVRVYDGEWDTKLTGFDKVDYTKTYWCAQHSINQTVFDGTEDFMYLDYSTATGGAYSYGTGIISDFTFTDVAPSDATLAFFRKYKLKYKYPASISGNGIYYYVYELACVDAIKTAAKEGKMSIRVSSTTSDRLSEIEQLNRFTSEWVKLIGVLDTSEEDANPQTELTTGAVNKVFGPLKNHVYLVLPTQTIYDDIVDRRINQNQPNDLNTTSQGVVADYTSVNPHHTPILIRENVITFEVGYLKEGTPSGAGNTTVDGYTVRNTGYNVTATSDMPAGQLEGLIFLGSFNTTAGAKTLSNLGFTKRTSGSLTYSELNRYNIYETLVTEDLLRNIKTSYPNQLIWSEPIVIGTNVSRGRNFTFSNFKTISSDFGDIVDIRYKDNILFVFCERGLCAITVGEILTSQGGQQVLIDSTRFLSSDFWVLKNLKSISLLSIAEGDNTLFFSDGFDVWMHDKQWKNITNGKITIDTIIGSYYDTYFKEYRLFTNTGSWFYSLEGDAWSGKHTISSGGGKAIGINVYDFNSNSIRKQNTGLLFGTNSPEVEVKFRLNTLDAPDVMKTWRKLFLETEGFGTIKYSDNTTTDKVTKSLASTQFQNGMFNVGISDQCNNAIGLVVTLLATGTAKLKNLVYHFTTRTRR